MKIALTGNPNSGKTTLFNAITGKVEKVGNWPGVTVDKKEGIIRSKYNPSDEEITAIDLPGAYSMSPFTSEESITSSFVKNENPDVIVNIVDATNLSRSLFFTTQLLELGIPVVIALNKVDMNDKANTVIKVDKLSKLLGCNVVETVATKSNNNGLDVLIKRIIKVNGDKQSAPFKTNIKDISDSSQVKESDVKRYNFVKKIVGQVESRAIDIKKKDFQDKADRVIAHKWLGIPIFAAVMWTVFAISQEYLGPLLADTFVGWIDSVYVWLEGVIGQSVSPFLKALFLDGIVGGVGALVGFLPLIMVLFFLLALLEDSGYMARVAVVMDRFFKKVGLSGRSIIPMVIGTGCAIPGVMATRTIKNDRQRKTTAILTPFMPCGAKLPIIALFAGVFFNDAAWIGTLMYFLAIAIIIVGALIVVRITGEKNKRSFFIMELPNYKVPSIKKAAISTYTRGKAFLIKAGTIILVSNAAVHLMQTFNWNLEVVAEGMEHTSILASVASPIAYLLVPLGFGTWRFAAAAVTGFIAKENVVGTLAVVFGITNFINTEELVLVSGASDVAGAMGLSSVAALSYLVFNLFTPPCFAAIGAMKAELEDNKWWFGAIGFQLSMGYIASFLVYQIGSLVTTGSFGAGVIPGLVVAVAIVAVIGYLMIKGEKSYQEDLIKYAQKG